LSAPLYSNYSTGTAGIDESYTATESETVLVINFETYGEANSQHTSSAQIATTGDVLWTNTQTSNYVAQTSRDCTLKLSLIALTAGQTITFTNTHSNTYATQMHIVFKVNSTGIISDELFETRVDHYKSDYKVFSPQSDGIYLLLVIETAPYSGTPATSIVGKQAESSCNLTSDAKIKATIGQYMLYSADTSEFNTETITAFSTKAFAAWKVVV
jgi:hypothetical protein